MTSVYGVTFVGARKQIQNVLGDKIIQRTEESGVSVAMNRSVWTGHGLGTAWDGPLNCV